MGVMRTAVLCVAVPVLRSGAALGRLMVLMHEAFILRGLVRMAQW
jgi:hypothetical protein